MWVRIMLSAIRLASATFVGAAASFSAATAEPFGTWLTGDRQAQIRVERCGTKLCGTIVWLKEPIDSATGRPQVDDKNPDRRKQRRPILGLRIFAMSAAGDGTWSGSIYNADDGKNYRATIRETSPAQLTVRGCAGIFCGDDTWTRVVR
jgi:uncharacterized protein (DUF2147 family)